MSIFFRVVLKLSAALLSGLMCVLPASAATILVYGDSLSAGYGLARGADWPALLQQRLRDRKTDYKVANVSISGETTLGGLNRIEQALREHRPALTIIALGANDGLRGASVETMRTNLERIIQAARRANSRVLLVGMQIPPNYGPQYTEKFRRSFGEIARAQRVPLVPFLLDGFAEKREMFQPDQLHPVAEAQPLILNTVWKVLGPELKLK
ncbi:MAG: arylesterase [Betaproteobacteria bacterium]